MPLRSTSRWSPLPCVEIDLALEPLAVRGGRGLAGARLGHVGDDDAVAAEQRPQHLRRVRVARARDRLAAPVDALVGPERHDLRLLATRLCPRALTLPSRKLATTW
jgi:hypothetical protein